MTETTEITYIEADTATGRVRGVWRGDSQRGEPGRAGASAAFLGIPFAQAPVGDLRFGAPVPPEPWSGVRDALESGATAQRGDPGITLIPEPSVPGDATLNVNVFTPAPGDLEAALPVMVWIHGGGFFSGSPASPWYDGRAFNRDGVVTVTISYRLGFDGFGHIDGAPSNRGVRDWLAALEWVQQNIRGFGGDPGQVTIAGQSAGGGAALTLLGMPAAQHLFNRAYSISGALADVSVERSRTLSAKIAAALGVQPTRAGFASVSEEALLAAQQAATQISAATMGSLIEDGLGLGPAIDGDLITRPTIESLAAGVGAGKPLVLGATEDEFSMAVADKAALLRWVPLRLLLGKAGLRGQRRAAYLAANRETVRRGHAAMLGRYVTDKMFAVPLLRTVAARGTAAATAQATGATNARGTAETTGTAPTTGQTTAPTWVYRFAHRSPVFDFAVHCIDVPMFFDCLDSPVGIDELEGPNPPQPLADAVHGAAVAFIRAGEPGWPAWSSRPGTTRIYGGPPSAPDVSPDGYASVRPLV